MQKIFLSFLRVQVVLLETDHITILPDMEVPVLILPLEEVFPDCVHRVKSHISELCSIYTWFHQVNFGKYLFRGN